MNHPEREFTKTVIQMAQRFGWHVAHFPRARSDKGAYLTPVAGNAKGYPDLTLVRERVLWAELKIPPNGLTVEQAEWVAKLASAGQEIRVWTPDDWPEIERVLKERRTTATVATLQP